MRHFRVFFILLFVIGLVACQTAQPEVKTAPDISTKVISEPTPALPVEEPILEIIGPNATKTLTLSELKGLPSFEGQAGIKSSTGKITPPEQFKGIKLEDLANLVGGFDETTGIVVEAEDGYSITFSYDQLIKGDFIAYDPGTGDETKPEGVLTTIIAYEKSGQPIPEKQEGTIRLAIVSPKNDQVTDGHWSVKWVRKLTIKPLAQDWSLHLEGAISELMDRGTFESGAAPNCHQAIWKDEKAQDWIGIPLYLMVGRVDDEIKHDGPAFNEELAKAGYTIDVIAKDGYTVQFDSARVSCNENIIVAYLVNGNPLDEKEFPLKLVGSDLKKNEMVTAIEKIVLNFDGIQKPTIEVTPEVQQEDAETSTSTAALTIIGKVENELSLSMDDIKAVENVKVTAKHPKKDQMQDYEGAHINLLLEKAGLKANSNKIVLVATDGFSAEIDLAAVQACADCLVAYDGGSLNAVMVGMDSNFWVKNLSSIEVK